MRGEMELYRQQETKTEKQRETEEKPRQAQMWKGTFNYPVCGVSALSHSQSLLRIPSPLSLTHLLFFSRIPTLLADKLVGVIGTVAYRRGLASGCFSALASRFLLTSKAARTTTSASLRLHLALRPQRSLLSLHTQAQFPSPRRTVGALCRVQLQPRLARLDCRQSTTMASGEVTFRVAHATTGRASCKECKQVIDKGALRIGKEAPSPFHDSNMVVWYHAECIFEK